MFKLTIEVPEHLEDKNHPKKIVEFSSKEEKDKFVEEENKFCQPQIIKKYTTWHKEDRDKAIIELYRARRNHLTMWNKKHHLNKDEKELA
jgi:hypothetical protein